jgi:pimeloyl-ACP methyl ester carboxylesterase
MVAGVTGRRAVKKTTTSRDGTRVAYWESGHGDQPLVLVHGATSDHTRWAPMLHLLEPHATVCAIDRRGRGASGDAGGYDIEREFEDVAAVVEAVANDAGVAVDVFGHSYGALCSLEAALLTPDIRRLALYEPPIASSGGPDLGDLLDVLEGLIADGRREEAAERFVRDAVGSPEDELELLKATDVWAVRVANIHTVLRELRAVAAYTFDAARFRTMTVPALVLLGGEQVGSVRDSVTSVAATLPNASLTVLEGQHHMAMDTAPELLIERLLEFFGRVAHA